MEKKVTFSLEDYKSFLGDEDPEFSMGRVCFLSTRPNHHELVFTDEILRRDAPTILGKFVVGNRDIRGDFMGHEESPEIYGYIPKDQQIEFKTKDGYTLACADILLSKIYAKNAVDNFRAKNFRNVSMEAIVKTREDNEDFVEEFNICGLTLLGDTYKGSCPDANVMITKFSADEAERKYRNLQKSEIHKFAENRRKKMEAKTYKIDKSKEAMSETPWGDIDKAKLRDTIMEAVNRDELVKAVYLLVEDGWEEAPSEHLKYPVMEEKDGTFVYNRGALAAAKAYAEQNDEEEVLEKIEEIYKDLELEGGESEKMTEEKLEQVVDEEEKKMEEEEVEQENCEEQEEIAEEEDFEAIKAERDSLKEKVEEQENIIMTKDNELEELRRFKEDIEKRQKMDAVSKALADVKEFVDAATYEALKAEGEECDMCALDAWINKTKSVAFDASKGKKTKTETDITRMSIPDTKPDAKKSVWDRI